MTPAKSKSWFTRFAKATAHAVPASDSVTMVDIRYNG